MVTMCAIAFTACSDDDNTKDPIDDDNGGEEMITAVYESEYEFDLELNIGTFKEGENITIAWGDGGVSEFKSFAITDSWGYYGNDELHYAIGQDMVKHKYPDYNAHTITIKGKIKEFYCYDVLTYLDVSKCTALTKLSCSDNNLTSLDVSKNTALTELSCGGNNLTSLDVSKNTALTELWCHNNNLSADALNKIFNDLPQGKKVNDGYYSQSTIYIYNNPGTNTCDKSIATNKGWRVQ